MCTLHIQLLEQKELKMKSDEDLRWNTGEKRRVFSSPILSVDLSHRTHGEKSGEFVTLALPDWVSVIPWMRRDDGVPVFLMERQFRHGSETVTCEFPAGLTEEGESQIEAAKRELREETGMEAEIVELASFNPNPAFMTNRQTFFLARNLKRTGEQRLDENEEIELLFVPVEEVIEKMGKGEYSNGIMLSALFAFMREAERDPDLRRTIR